MPESAAEPHAPCLLPTLPFRAALPAEFSPKFPVQLVAPELLKQDQCGHALF